MFLENNRSRIEKQFETFCQKLPGVAVHISKRMDALNPDVVLALKYLYVCMPYSDAGNYSFDTFLDFAWQGIYLWKNSPYRFQLSEELYLNYVLFHRVNEEEIKPCRTLFWEKIKKRIQGLSMKEAILEINHWCCQEAMYQSTDCRTSSALDVYRHGFGRCGEESVFAVNVLRSAGIPARQVYVPRWSHCDDNHAWVEVWCDGDWHYLGACEPEADLDRGWFTNAASRAMMIRSRWFDKIPPENEDVIGMDDVNLMLNQLPRYAHTKRITIHITDLDGCSVPDAEVRAEILNYSQFTPVARLRTDANGCVSFVTGFGSLHICAIYGETYGECLINTREDDHFECMLGEGFLEDEWEDFNMTAPDDTVGNLEPFPADLEKANNDRVAAESAKCRHKAAKFQPLWRNCLFGHELKVMEELMSVLSEKDQKDVYPEILDEHYREASVYGEMFPRDFFLHYIWNPRIDDEILTKWRRSILGYFSQEQQDQFRSKPFLIWQWIEDNIQENDQQERRTVYTTPAAALRLKIAGSRSRAILFVAIARTLGIPARLNPEDGAMEYWENKGFAQIHESRRKDARLVITGEEQYDWTYSRNWALAKADKNGYLFFQLEDIPWQKTGITLDVEPGYYRVITSNRLPSGTIFASRYDFHVAKGETHRISLRHRNIHPDQMMNPHPIPDFNLRDQAGNTDTISRITDGTRRILLWLDPGKEPTQHILNELMEMKDDFSAIQNQLIFILENEEAAGESVFSQCLQTFPKAGVYFASFGKEKEMTARKMYTDSDRLPLMVITDGALTGCFASAGYSVGMADMLLKIFRL